MDSNIPLSPTLLSASLFAGLEPPCEAMAEDGLVISGNTFSGQRATVVVRPERCTFTGCAGDLDAARGACAERRCSHERE